MVGQRVGLAMHEKGFAKPCHGTPSSSVRRLVCVDEAGVVRGIVSLSDVFRLITGGREVPQPEPEPFA